jgi:hypothetical protein
MRTISTKWASIQLLKGASMFLFVIILSLSLLIMLSFSKTFRQFVIKNKLLFFWFLFIFCGFIIFYLFVSDYFYFDACLDNGGRWDKELKICNYEKQLSQNRSNRQLLLRPNG